MPKRVTYNEFSGGINNTSPANHIEDNELSDALNVIFDKTSNLKVRNGLKRINWNKNLLTRTEEFDHADWGTINSPIITSNTDVAPDSTTTADTIEDDIDAGGEGITQSVSCSNDEKYTSSLYIKKVTSTPSHYPSLQLRFDTGGTIIIKEIIIDNENGVLVDSSGRAPNKKGISDEGDYWRVFITDSNDGTGNTKVYLRFFPAQAADLSGNISGTAVGSQVIWGAQLERGILSDYHRNIATAPTQADNYIFDRITSVFDFQRSDGTNKVICTAGNQIYRLHNDDYLEPITGSLNLPNDTYWQWVIYDDVAIGVNRATTASGKDGIIKIEDHVSDAKGLDWNRNHLLYTERFEQTVAWKHIGTPVITTNQEENPVGGEKNADYIKDDSTNLLEKTQEFDDSYWTTINTPIVTTNTDIAPDGTETADTVEDDDNAAFEGLVKSNNCSDSDIFFASIHVKKTTSATHYPSLRIMYVNGTSPINAEIVVDTDNGVLVDISGSSPDDKGVEDKGTYWRVWFKFQNNATGNNSIQYRIFPAKTTTLDGNQQVATMGSTVFWGAQLEKDELTDYHAPSNEGVYQEIVVNDSETYIASVHIRKTSGASFYPVLRLRYLNGTSEIDSGVIVDTNNGALVDITGEAPDDKAIIDTGSNYWRVWIKKANNATKNDAARLEIFPAYASALTGALDPFATGQNTFWGAQLEEDTLSKYAKNEANSFVSEPPRGNYSVVWNNRVWIVDADEPNTLVGSGLADFEDWATPGSAGSQKFSIGGAEGDIITGLAVHKDRLFVFKTDRTYYLQPGNPNTDITQYDVRELSSKIGCVSGYSIQSLVDDLVFLSKYGIASLSAVEKFGDFENAIVSQKIDDLSKFQIDEVNSASIVVPSESQYWLAAPLNLGSIHSDSWIMDFTNLQQNRVGFTRFDGKIVGASYGVVDFQGRDRVYVGGYKQADDEDIAYLYRYGDDGIYNDDGKFYDIILRTKSHSPGESINNSEFIRVFFLLELITDNLSLSLAYKFNESAAKVKSWSQIFSAEIFVGAIWDSSLWDTGVWASSDTLERRVDRKVIGTPGRIARSIQFSIGNVNVDEAFIFKGFGFDYELVTHKKD